MLVCLFDARLLFDFARSSRGARESQCLNKVRLRPGAVRVRPVMVRTGSVKVISGTKTRCTAGSGRAAISQMWFKPAGFIVTGITGSKEFRMRILFFRARRITRISASFVGGAVVSRRKKTPKKQGLKNA